MKWHHNCLEHLCTILFENKKTSDELQTKCRTFDSSIWIATVKKSKKKISHNIIIGKTTKEHNRYIFSRKAANRMKRKIKTIALRDWHFSNLFSAGTTKKTRRNNNGTSIPFSLSYIFYREKQHRSTSVHINALTKLLLLRKINQLSWRNCTAHRPEKKTVSCAPERLSERHTVKKRDNDPLARIALKDRRRSTVAVRKEDNSNNSRSSKTCYYNRQKRTLVKKKTKIDRKC